MAKIRFVAFAGEDPNGSPLGELTEIFAKAFTPMHNDLGSGSFSINRHSHQAAWAIPGNYVKVHLDHHDAIFGFWLESGSDVVVSTDEHGGETLQRSGRGTLGFLDRAIIWNVATASVSGVPNNDGYWHWTDAGIGTVLADLLTDAAARGVQLFDVMTLDFDASTDSNGDAWPVIAGDFKLQIGTDLLSVTQQLIAAGLWIKVDADLTIHAYGSDPGSDLSGSVTFARGANIRESAERSVQSTPIKSHVLVEGDASGVALVFQDVHSSDLEGRSKIGRREGFTTYEASNDPSVLEGVGQTLLARLKQLDDGPTSLGVTRPGLLGDTGPGPHYEPFVDYAPGDKVTVNVPGVFNHVVKEINAVTLTEDDAGDYLPSIAFEATPFNPTLGDVGAPQPGTGGAGPRGGVPVVPPPSIKVPVPLERCSAYTPTDTYPPLLSATSDSNGFLIYTKTGSTFPTVPTPGFVGSWNFPNFAVGGVTDEAGDCTGNFMRIIVGGNGRLTIPTGETGGGHTWTATVYHVNPIGGALVTDASYSGAYGTPVEILLTGATVSGWCYHIVDVTDTAGTCGFKLIYSGFTWALDPDPGDVTLDDVVQGIQGVPIAPTPPADGQFLAYNAALDEYIPTTPVVTPPARTFAFFTG